MATISYGYTTDPLKALATLEKAGAAKGVMTVVIGILALASGKVTGPTATDNAKGIRPWLVEIGAPMTTVVRKDGKTADQPSDLTAVSRGVRVVSGTPALLDLVGARMSAADMDKNIAAALAAGGGIGAILASFKDDTPKGDTPKGDSKGENDPDSDQDDSDPYAKLIRGLQAWAGYAIKHGEDFAEACADVVATL